METIVRRAFRSLTLFHLLSLAILLVLAQLNSCATTPIERDPTEVHHLRDAWVQRGDARFSKI